MPFRSVAFRFEVVMTKVKTIIFRLWKSAHHYNHYTVMYSPVGLCLWTSIKTMRRRFSDLRQRFYPTKTLQNRDNFRYMFSLTHFTPVSFRTTYLSRPDGHMFYSMFCFRMPQKSITSFFKKDPKVGEKRKAAETTGDVNKGLFSSSVFLSLPVMYQPLIQK